MTAENRFCKRFIVWEKFELAEYIEGLLLLPAAAAHRVNHEYFRHLIVNYTYALCAVVEFFRSSCLCGGFGVWFRCKARIRLLGHLPGERRIVCI